MFKKIHKIFKKDLESLGLFKKRFKHLSLNGTIPQYDNE